MTAAGAAVGRLVRAVVPGERAAPVPQADGAGAVARAPRAASAAAKGPVVRGARQTAASSRAGSTLDSARSALGAPAADPGRRESAAVTRSAPLTRSAPHRARCAAAIPATRRLESASTTVFAPAAEMRPKTARVRPTFQTRSARSRSPFGAGARPSTPRPDRGGLHLPGPTEHLRLRLSRSRGEHAA